MGTSRRRIRRRSIRQLIADLRRIEDTAKAWRLELTSALPKKGTEKAGGRPPVVGANCPAPQGGD
jgi:hypothetical protein